MGDCRLLNFLSVPPEPTQGDVEKEVVVEEEGCEGEKEGRIGEIQGK